MNIQKQLFPLNNPRKKRRKWNFEAFGIFKMFQVTQRVPGVGDATVSEDLVKKPSSEVMCPESEHPLRLKQLIKLQLTPVTSKSEKEKGRYQCPSCCRVLTKAVKTILYQVLSPIVLHKWKDCGHVICQVCHDKTKQDSACFVCSKKFKDRHVIKIQTGGKSTCGCFEFLGTGYSGGTGEKLTAKIVTATAWV